MGALVKHDEVLVASRDLSTLWRRAERIGKVDVSTRSVEPKYYGKIMHEVGDSTVFSSGYSRESPEEALYLAIEEAERRRS